MQDDGTLIRLMVVLIPLVVVIIPALKLVPVIYRWYGVLMAIERDTFSDPTPEQKEEILRRLDRVEHAVNQIRTPLSFADQLFVLRSHVNMVRDRLAHEISGR